MDRQRIEVAAAAGRHGLSRAAGEALFAALVRGGGRQAQFDHPDLGGMGQWSGGMTQVGAMFDDALKAKVAGFCRDMADVAARAAAGPEQSSQVARMPAAGVRASGSSWWPAELGTPAAVGAQDGLRYACFPERRRLVIERDGRIVTYDTGHHRLTGFAQQQGETQTLLFSGPDGTVPLEVLRALDP